MQTATSTKLTHKFSFGSSFLVRSCFIKKCASLRSAQNPDSDGRPDSVLADIWWSNHLRRELSIIVAIFNGQEKSTLTCSSCGYASARFVPFNILTLSLPEEEKRIALCEFVPKDR